MVFPNALLLFDKYDTLKLFRWMKINKYFEEIRWDLKKYIKDNELDNNTIKVYNEALKAYKE